VIRTLGHFEIREKLGAGGMGEVFRARDTRLDLDVALKVLPETVATDAERMARFAREAKLLAALNHPNIASIHGLEEENGVRALVLELVDGPTLAQRIAQGPIPLEEALVIARQIAEALEYAHERGIIHRDLKPENVKLRPDGAVKILDFGLAKALDPSSGISRSGAEPSLSPTLTAAATQAGVILGTAACMAPEQAKGRPADERADIWALGCVLFEMLTGRRPFEGDTVTEALAAILRAEPDWAALPPGTPHEIRRLAVRGSTIDSRIRRETRIRATTSFRTDASS
jgi:serine/threonine-protein kinase